MEKMKDGHFDPDLFEVFRGLINEQLAKEKQVEEGSKGE